LNPSDSRLLLAAVAAGRRSLPTKRLFHAFQTPESILRATPRDLDAIRGLHNSTKKALISARDHPLDREQVHALARQGVRLISYECSEYPDRLRQIADPPPVLFIKGRILAEDERALAVIGSRRAGAYGTAVCDQLVSGLVKSGFCIVSGMARGIDTVAHWSALDHGGRTAGVLGTGIDRVYPRSNKALFARVPEQGFLVSEFPPGTEARPENFPRRNRIISGLSCGVLVVEATERSGTMITVRLALEEGREIFAVPGDIRSPLSRGTHRLIQQGAKLVGCVEEILEEFPYLAVLPEDGRSRSAIGAQGGSDIMEGADPKAEPGEDLHGEQGDARAVLQIMDDVGTGLETLLRRTGWPLEKLSLLLTELELSGRVKRVPGNRYARLA